MLGGLLIIWSLTIISSSWSILYSFIFFVVIFISCSFGNKTIKIKGSDTEVNLAAQLAESFHQINQGIFVSISVGESGLGVAYLLNGTADLANSSRSINTEKIKQFLNKGIHMALLFYPGCYRFCRCRGSSNRFY